MDTLLLHLQVFYEAVWLASLVPMGNDTAFHAMKSFGNHNMVPAAILSAVGGALGQMFNYYLGMQLQRIKYTRNMTLSEDAYIRFKYYFNRFAIYALLVCWAPLCKLLPLLAGFSNASWRKVLLLVSIAYIFHYTRLTLGYTLPGI